MKKMLGLFVMVGFQFGFFPELAHGIAENYRVLPTSELKFRVRNFGITSVEGRFQDFSGHMLIDDNFENSRATAEISTSSVNSENEERDTHLKNSDFFDVKAHPKMIFISKSIKGTKSDFVLSGELEIKKIPKPVTLKCAEQNSDRAAIAFKCEGEIDRTHYGITHGGTIGDKVKLELLIAGAK